LRWLVSSFLRSIEIRLFRVRVEDGPVIVEFEFGERRRDLRVYRDQFVEEGGYVRLMR
jgi:hypothetical protein